MATDPRWGGSAGFPNLGITGAQAKTYAPWAIGGVVAIILIIVLFKLVKNKKISTKTSSGGSSGSLFSGSGGKLKKAGDFFFSGDEDSKSATSTEKEIDFKDMTKDEKARKKAEIISRILRSLDVFLDDVKEAKTEFKNEEYTKVVTIMETCLDNVIKAKAELQGEKKILGRVFSIVIEDFLNNIETMFNGVKNNIEIYNNLPYANNLLNALEQDLEKAINVVGNQKLINFKSMVIEKLRSSLSTVKRVLESITAKQKRTILRYCHK